MSVSKIEWTDVVWNPIAGCSKVSAGCKHCYAERMAARCVAMGQEKYVGTVDGAGRWTGKVNFDEKALLAPLGWRKPRMVFVNSMSDLFHPEVPDEWVDRVFAVMALCPQHVFQVLTKRPERMLAYLAELAVGPRVLERIEWTGAAMVEDGDRFHVDQWPLRNVWLGSSVENQATADERVPVLLGCPAAVRFLSCEPLLGAVDVSRWLRIKWRCSYCCGYFREYFDHCPDCEGYKGFCGSHKFNARKTPRNGIFPSQSGIAIDWVIVGGESGVGSGIRPMHPDWARGLRDQCVGAGVPFFFKQWGEYLDSKHMEQRSLDEMKAWGKYLPKQEVWFSPGINPATMYKVQKKNAGRLLDGREWDEMPGSVDGVDKVDEVDEVDEVDGVDCTPLSPPQAGGTGFVEPVAILGECS